jgi:fumarate reductase flavoprotein subunit
MRRKWLVLALIFTAAIILSVFTLWAAQDRTAFLAGVHTGKGLDCAACHGDSTRVDDNETAVNAKCVECHGSLEQVAKKSSHEINPHKSHLGDMSCSVCHHGHVSSWTYCLNCHGFDLKIPAGGMSAGLPSIALPTVKKTDKKILTEKTDIVIVGAGATGLTAAITAHDKGAKVILLEKMPISGGNSQLAAGGMNAADTRYQKAKDIKDSVELMFEDTMKGGKKINDPELVRILAKNSSRSIDWLTSLGADVSDVGRLGGASVNRTHRPTGGAAVGAHITQVLKKNAADRKIDIRLNSRVVQILKNSKGRVTGVLVESKHRGYYRIMAKAVVLTTGGFSANPQTVAKYQPSLKGMTTSNQPGATGDGMTLGEQAGGYLIDMKEIQIHPTVAAGSRILITEAVRGNGAIMVNQEGKRFINEITTRDAASAAILKQTGKIAYLILDEGIRKSLKQIDGYFHLNLVVTGETLRDLAEKIKAPADALEATVDAYNKSFDEKKDQAFQRPDMPRPVRTPKFYAIKVQPGIHYTMGGLKVNTKAEVMSRKGKPVPGLFAAGEGTGGVHGANRLGGNSVSQTITFGRIAGANAANLVKK